MKVNLFLVGFQKSGTTSLALWLKSHPNIFLPRHKEPHYFSKNTNLDEKLYIKNFNLNAKYQYFLDASTSYGFYHEYPQTPYNIYKYKRKYI